MSLLEFIIHSLSVTPSHALFKKVMVLATAAHHYSFVCFGSLPSAHNDHFKA